MAVLSALWQVGRIARMQHHTWASGLCPAQQYTPAKDVLQLFVVRGMFSSVALKITLCFLCILHFFNIYPVLCFCFRFSNRSSPRHTQSHSLTAILLIAKLAGTLNPDS